MSNEEQTNQTAQDAKRPSVSDLLYCDLVCDHCGRTFNTGYEGVTTSNGRELCIYCNSDEDALEPGEFIPD